MYWYCFGGVRHYKVTIIGYEIEMKLTRLSSIAAVAVTLLSCTPKVTEPLLVLHNLQLVDVDTGQLVQDQLVVIKQDRIQAILPSTELSSYPKSQQLDAGGRYLIPALWDMHVHFEGRDLVEDNALLLPVYLAYGITGVREAASNLAPVVLNWRTQVEQGKLLGPKIFTAGQKFEGIDSLWDGDLEIGNEAEMLAGMDKLQQMKVDFIKITENTLQPDLYLATIKEAKKRGLLVSSHAPYGTSIQQLAEAGLSSLEHASYLVRLGFADEASIAAAVRAGTLTNQQAAEHYKAGFDQQQAIKGYRMLKQLNVAVTPTLIGGQQLAHLHDTDHSHDEFLKYLTKDFTSNYQWRIDRMANETPAQQQQRKDKELLIASQLPYLLQSGVTLLAGSDSAALNTYVYPAQALHDELELFQQAGLTPAQILQTATINGARFMHEDKDYGSISVGKKADLVLLNQNPLVDIKASRSIDTLVYQGRVYDRATLDQLLQQAEKRKLELEKSAD